MTLELLGTFSASRLPDRSDGSMTILGEPVTLDTLKGSDVITVTMQAETIEEMRENIRVTWEQWCDVNDDDDIYGTGLLRLTRQEQNELYALDMPMMQKNALFRARLSVCSVRHMTDLELQARAQGIGKKSAQIIREAVGGAGDP